MTASPNRPAPPVVETRLVHAHGLAAIITLLISVAFGILASIKLIAPDIAGNSAWLTWGRLRYDHTQGIMLGWLANAFFAFLYHAVPLLTGRPVTSVRLGQWIFGLWNFAVVAPGWVLVLAGFSQPLEWAEFPLVIDAFVVLALLLVGIQFLPPFFSRGLEDLYVSSWYIIGALVFTLLAYPMGNFVPELVPGARGAAFSGLWIHDAIGLFVTPLAVAILYFVDSRGDAQADLQPLPFDAGLLAAVLSLPAERDAPLYLFRHSDERSDRRHHSLDAARRGRYYQRRQSAPVAARLGLLPARYRAPVRGNIGSSSI